MPAAKITKSTVDAAKTAARDYFLWDSEVPGFGLKVTPAGGRIYVYQYRAPSLGNTRAMPTRRLTMGKHGELTPDQARKEAKRLAALVTQGTDPRQQSLDAHAAKAEAKRQAEERERLDEELAFEKVAANWLAEYELDHRPRSYEQAKLVVDKHLTPKLKGMPLPAISDEDLQAIIDGIPARRKASRRTVHAYASIFWKWALEEKKYIAKNPVATMRKPKGPKARDRVLDDAELASIWQATETIRAPLGAFYRVLLLTGQRREEVAGMDWAELDRASATWIIPASRAKNDTAHIVPLAPAVVDELDRLSLARQAKAGEEASEAKRWPKGGPVMSIRGGVSLSCFSQAKRLLDAHIEKVRDGEAIDAWRVHDLRRTLATGLQKLGTRFEVTEAVLNHVSGAKGGVAGIYQRHDWKEEKRAALREWAASVAAFVAGIYPSQFTNENDEADPKAWRKYIRACVENGGKPVPQNSDNVVPFGAAQKSAG